MDYGLIEGVIMPARTYLPLLVNLAISGTLGCATLPNGKLADSSPKRQPRPSTLVAYGELYGNAATDPGR